MNIARYRAKLPGLLPYFWNEAIGEMRLVTSFDTEEEDVDKLIACIKAL